VAIITPRQHRIVLLGAQRLNHQANKHPPGLFTKPDLPIRGPTSRGDYTADTLKYSPLAYLACKASLINCRNKSQQRHSKHRRSDKS
jgi:hypothetical protein